MDCHRLCDDRQRNKEWSLQSHLFTEDSENQEDWTAGKNHYEVLGIDRQSSREQIIAAYRRLIQQYHPDISSHPKAHNISVSLNEAYSVLSDADKRSDYDYRLLNGLLDTKPSRPRWIARDPLAFEARTYQMRLKRTYSSQSPVYNLFWAASIEDLDLIERSINQGADIDAQDIFGFTPFLKATLQGRHSLMRYLFNLGANPEQITEKCFAPLLSVVVAYPEHVHDTVRLLLKEMQVRPDIQDTAGETAMHHAARLGDLQLVELLLNAGADPNGGESATGETPLMAAIISGHDRICSALIRSGANIEQRDREGKTALLVGMQRAPRIRMIDILIEAGAQTDAQDNDGRNAVHQAALAANGRMLRKAVSLGIDVNRRGHTDRSPLDEVIYSDLPIDKACNMVERLIKYGADPNSKGRDGLTPLMRAIQQDKYRLVAMLVKCNADVNARDSHGVPALHVAIMNESRWILVTLVRAGADVDSLGPTGMRPIHLAALISNADTIEVLAEAEIDARVQNENDNPTALLLVTARGSVACTNRLIKLGSDVNASDNLGYTPLAYAARHVDYRLVKSLLQAGADPNTSDHLGWTPLHWAVHSKNIQVVNALIEASADPNVKNQDGVSPLHSAVDTNRINIAKKLLSAGSDPNQEGPDGATPLHWAAFGGLEVMYSLLIQKGANSNLPDAAGITPKNLRKSSHHYYGAQLRTK